MLAGNVSVLFAFNYLEGSVKIADKNGLVNGKVWGTWMWWWGSLRSFSVGLERSLDLRNNLTLNQKGFQHIVSRTKSFGSFPKTWTHFFINFLFEEHLKRQICLKIGFYRIVQNESVKNSIVICSLPKLHRKFPFQKPFTLPSKARQTN